LSDASRISTRKFKKMLKDFPPGSVEKVKGRSLYLSVKVATDGSVAKADRRIW
jgi:hypothetical protein